MAPRKKKSETTDLFTLVCTNILGLDPASKRAGSLKEKIEQRAGSYTDSEKEKLTSMEPSKVILTDKDLCTSVKNTIEFEKKLKSFLG